MTATLQGHPNDLIQLNENGLLVSVSSSEIRIWDLKTSQCKYILQGQSFAWDRTIMLWNLTTITRVAYISPLI